MSRTCSGIPPSCAWTSGAEPLRPDRVALPPAKLKLVGASAQPSPERVNTAAWLSTSGWFSMRPLPVRRMLSGAISASVEKAKFAPRRPAKAARTCPLPLISRALAVRRARVTPPMAMPRASVLPSIVVLPASRTIVPSARPVRTAKASGKLAFVAARCASMRCAWPTGEKSSVPPSVPFASVRRPRNPPETDFRSPLACAPPASSAAMAITAGASCGSRICPLLVNGPSREPPLAR